MLNKLTFANAKQDYQLQIRVRDYIMTLRKIMNDLDSKIKSKFKLFSGARSQEEDQKVYDKVMDLCFDEMMSFAGENLSEADQTEMLNKMKESLSDEDKTKVFTEYLSKIEDSNFRLDERIETFLNNEILSYVN